MNNSASVNVQHNTAQSRFETNIEGHACLAEYTMAGSVMRMTHTFVHPSLEGRGIAAALVRAAFEFARANSLKIDPLCSYVRVYMQRHPETQDLHA